ncbi:MAG: NAD(P)-dependent oxidoreductase [bacterium]|jgi:2-hydroxy-3-oxopropionate reductase|nr:NAD(P)-dependent oxidoreductase [Betaproteobacteria bacterium]
MSATSAMRVGVIGLGVMGRPMAANLLRAGFQVSVFARRAAATAPLVAEGATACASPAQLAARCDAVVTVVTADADVEQVLFGPGGAAEGLAPGSLVIDHSTISPSTARACAARLAAQSVQMLDAPVSGGEAGAIAGSLSIMAGGDADAFERARPLLQAVGRTLVHVGDCGAGQVAKAANQLAICVTLQGMAEAFCLAEAHGIDPQALLDSLRSGTTASRMLEVMGPKMATGDTKAGVESRLHWKDLRIVLDAARRAGIALPGVAIATQTFSALQKAGGERLDSSAILGIVRRR